MTEWQVTYGASCPKQLRHLNPEDVRSQLKFREVIERNYSYVRVRAQIAGTDRAVAVHLIEILKLDARPGLRQQVLHTVQCYAALEHEHILQFYVAFEDMKYVYVVTELETGPDVQDLLRCNPSIPDAEVHGVAVAGVAALVYLHRKGLIHGAISPHSFVSCQSNVWKVKFPIVNDAAHNPGNNRHLPYLAPEQVIPQLAEQPYRSCLTPKVDMWNLAAVVFHCLVGYAPFGPIHVGEDPTEGILQDDPFIPAAIPPVLSWIILHGLTKPVHLRCSALDAWIALLQTQADEPHGGAASDSDAESCSLPMWAAREPDSESDSLLAWPEDESPKWMVSTVPDIPGPSDQIPVDDTLVDRHHGDTSCSEAGSGSLLAAAGTSASGGLSAAEGGKGRGSEAHGMGGLLREQVLDAIGSCPDGGGAGGSGRRGGEKAAVASCGCSFGGGGGGLVPRGIRDLGLQKRSRQLMQQLTMHPARELSGSLDTANGSYDQEQGGSSGRGAAGRSGQGQQATGIRRLFSFRANACACFAGAPAGPHPQ